MLFDSIKYSINNLLRNFSRTLLCGLGITIGVISIITIWSIAQTGKNAIDNELDSMGMNGISVMAKSGNLTNNDLNTIRLQNNVANAVPVIFGSGVVKKDSLTDKAITIGIDADSKGIISLEIIEGREISLDDIKNNTRVCIIDMNTAQSYFGNKNAVGQKIILNIFSKKLSFEIVGVANVKSSLLKFATEQYIPTTLYLPYTTMQHYKGNDQLNQVVVKFKDTKDIEHNASKVISAVSSSYTDGMGRYSYQDLASQRDKLSSTLNIITLILTAVGGISLFVAAIGSMTVMLISVNQRTKEIGIRKTLGQSRAGIVFDFVCEAAILFITFAVIGILLSALLLMAANKLLNLNLYLTNHQIFTVLAVNLLFGCFFGIFPAIKASKLKPVDALQN